MKLRNKNLLHLVVGCAAFTFGGKAFSQVADIPGDYGTGSGTATSSALHALSLGASSSASENYGISIGVGADVSGNSGISVGRTSMATGEQSAAYGYDADATGDQSLAVGRVAVASASKSTAIGNLTTASGSHSTAIGARASSSHLNSTAIGARASTTAQHQIALGASSSHILIQGLSGTDSALIEVDSDGVVSRSSTSLSGISANTSAISSNDDDISSLNSLIKTSGSEVQIGSDSNGVTISSNAVSVAGENLIRKDSDGSIHIGENSLVLKESGGRQQMWATDANGDSIDIDITNGSRLLINGRDVEKSIDNVGALSAALGSVPAISADSQFTCGFGAGTHSSAYALSGGCASRVSDRVSVNAALATVINNHTGDSDDNLSARAGFTFRLGKIDDSPKVAARKAAELHDKVDKLEERNESLLALLQAQASRLERLEKIASGQLSLLGDRASSD